MQAGDVIDHKYRIETQLGEGGMGKVFAATHLTLASTVAIKVLKADALSHPEVPMRFLREARAAGRLRNEHVARVSDVGQLASGEPYMVMEMLHGYDLATRLKQGALEPPRAVEYIVQACEGLAEAHAQGMVHRDVKPANLFVTTRPNGAPLVKLLDFGIATAAIGDVDHGLTSTQSVIGSPSYMSPEQLRATRDVDARSDIWSLGVTLYELLADRQPFIAPTITALSLKIVGDPHPPIDGIPAELMAILDRCLAKDREHRFGNVADLAAALAPLFPNGQVAAEMVLGSLSQPVPPTLMEASDPAATNVPAQDPSHAGWRMPSAPHASLTTNGLAAGESAALSRYGGRRRSRRATWGIAIGSLIAAGGIVTGVLVARSGARDRAPLSTPSSAPTMSSPAGTPAPSLAPSVAPAAPDPTPAPTTPPATTAATPTVPPNTAATPPETADPATPDVAAAVPVKPTKPTRIRKPSRPRPAKPDGPVTRPDTSKPDTTRPAIVAVPPPPVPIKDPPKPPPPKPMCAPSDKTCGL